MGRACRSSLRGRRPGGFTASCATLIEETFVVHEGRLHLRRWSEQAIEARASEIVIAPPGSARKFTSTSATRAHT